MPRTVDELTRLLELHQQSPGLYLGEQPTTNAQRTFGGQVLGQALAAALRTVPPERSVHSMHAYFIRPGRIDAPITYEVETIRDGRSFSVRRVIALQHSAEIFTANLSFQVHEDGLDHEDVQPDVAPPEECPTLQESLGQHLAPERRERWEKEWGAIECRVVDNTRGRGLSPDREHSGAARVWVRAGARLPETGDACARLRLHQIVLAYVSDLTLLAASTMPHGVTFSTPGMQAASLDHTIWFHRPVRADDWVLYDQVSPSASGGRGLSVARMFQDGHLVATLAQEGLIRLTGPVRRR